MSNESSTLRALDVFPDLSDELDRRIGHSETRIKYWVLVGVITNFLIALSAAIPVIWVSANIAADIRGAMSTQQAQAIELRAREKWMNDRMIWEARVEAALAQKNIRVEHTPTDMRTRP
jgi:hypothetical protein